MKYYITQYYNETVKDLFNLTSPINKSFAEKNGFEYISNNTLRITDGREIYWEKIAWIREFLPSIEEGSYVVYEDCDSLNLKGDLKSALPEGLDLGMVSLRGGLGGKNIIDWYNSGVIVMINNSTTRDFLERSWNKGGRTDEDGLNAELKSNGFQVGNGKPICELGVQWNCWRNNEKLCTDPKIKSWHGMSLNDKLDAIKKYIKDNKLD